MIAVDECDFGGVRQVVSELGVFGERVIVTMYVSRK